MDLECENNTHILSILSEWLFIHTVIQATLNSASYYTSQQKQTNKKKNNINNYFAKFHLNLLFKLKDIFADHKLTHAGMRREPIITFLLKRFGYSWPFLF